MSGRGLASHTRTASPAAAGVVIRLDRREGAGVSFAAGAAEAQKGFAGNFSLGRIVGMTLALGLPVKTTVRAYGLWRL